MEIGSVWPGSPLEDASFLIPYSFWEDQVLDLPGIVCPVGRVLFNKLYIPSGFEI
jgi:hypothetical protein